VRDGLVGPPLTDYQISNFCKQYDTVPKSERVSNFEQFCHFWGTLIYNLALAPVPRRSLETGIG